MCASGTRPPSCSPPADLEQVPIRLRKPVGSVEETAAVAGRLALSADREIDQMGDPDPRKRPMIVVFVDHMERLQAEGASRLGEATLNRLISRLPHCLFVVTGRRSLRGAEVEARVPAEPQSWPLLSTEHPPSDEPRQHAMGNLHEPRCGGLLSTWFRPRPIPVAADLVSSLAASTDGWPLHLHTIVTLARERSRRREAPDRGRPRRAAPHLVERLLDDLPPDVGAGVPRRMPAPTPTSSSWPPQGRS